MKNFFDYFWPISAIVLFIFLIVKNDNNIDSPRDKKGIDTIVTYDSVYVISFKIKEAYEKNHESLEQQ